jgi:LmbE family N-acetylglucosaminyl deacetylase
MKRLLGVFAHPDDESVACGGTIAKYARAGWQIDIVTATKGDAGGPAEVRAKELEEAAGVLGIRSITFLDYKDGKLSAMHPGEIEDALLQVMRESTPNVVITHETGGITNHPDHIKMSYATTFAFQTYAQFRHDQNPDDPNPPKLYYACFPESTISYLIKHRYFPSKLFDQPVRGVDDKRITTVIDIRRFASLKTKALHSHKTQAAILAKYFGIPHNPFFQQEYFVLRMRGEQEVFMGKNDRVSDRL